MNHMLFFYVKPVVWDGNEEILVQYLKTLEYT